MSHRWELSWTGSGSKTGTDIVEAPTLNEAIYIWQLDENQRLEQPNENYPTGPFEGRPWPRRIIKVRWKSEVSYDDAKPRPVPY